MMKNSDSHILSVDSIIPLIGYHAKMSYILEKMKEYKQLRHDSIMKYGTVKTDMVQSSWYHKWLIGKKDNDL